MKACPKCGRPEGLVFCPDCSEQNPGLTIKPREKLYEAQEEEDLEVYLGRRRPEARGQAGEVPDSRDQGQVRSDGSADYAPQDGQAADRPQVDP